MKRIAVFLLVILLIPCTAFAAGNVDVSLNTGENFKVTVNCDEGTSAIAFVYTYKKAVSGIKTLYSVKKYDVSFGGSCSFDVNPPQDGYVEKLAVFDRITLSPLCPAYEYPYIINISTEPLGFRLKDYGTAEKDGKTYVMNEYDLTGFQYAEDEFSAVSLLAKAASF